MAGPRATISGRGYDLWQRRVSAMAVGSEHHSVHAHQGQHSPQEKPVLWSRAFYLRARIQSLHLSRRPATELWWSGLSQSRLRLYWNPQTLRCVFAKNTVHQCPFPLSEHSPARSRPATRQGLSEHARFPQAQRQRKKLEALFAQLKNQIGLRRLRLRRLKFVREQFFLAAAAQNIKRLVRFLSHVPRPIFARNS